MMTTKTEPSAPQPKHRPEHKPFELIAGHAALDLVNTLGDRFKHTGPDELLKSYDDLLRFLTQSGLLTARQAKKLKRLEASAAEREQVVAQVRELREALATIGYARLEESDEPGKSAPEAAITVLEGYFKQSAQHRILAAEGNHFHWTWKGLSKQIAAPLWLLAQSAAALLTSEDIAKIRSCASDTCRWLFLDTSKNHTRRWCEMKTCGNRMKARRFQSRQTAPS